MRRERKTIDYKTKSPNDHFGCSLTVPSSFAFIRGSKIQVRMIESEVKEADAAEIFQRGLQLRTDFIDGSIRMGVEEVFLRFRLGLRTARGEKSRPE